MNCRFCSNTALDVFKIKSVPLSGYFPKEANEKILEGDLTLQKCQSCGLVQLKENYPLEKMYGENYGYRSGLNPSMVKHLKQNIELINSKIKLVNNDLVIDIASNDGTTLRQYKNKNLIRHGVDPTASKFSSYYEKGTTFTPKFFNLNTANEIENKFNKKAKIITSFSVFYDLPDPKLFVNGIERLLDKDGIWMAEQSYLPLMIKTNSFDTICHEHLEYYCLTDIKNLLKGTSLELFDVEFNSINGGSFIFFVAQKDNNFVSFAKEKIDKIIEEEKKSCSFASLKMFIKKCNEQKDIVKAWFSNELSKGKKIAGLGASTKGNIALSFFELSSKQISIIGDINKDKFGSYTPVGSIPIIDQEELLEMNFDYFVVLPWHFKKYFISQKLFEGKKLVFLHPELEIIEIKP